MDFQKTTQNPSKVYLFGWKCHLYMIENAAYYIHHWYLNIQKWKTFSLASKAEITLDPNVSAWVVHNAIAISYIFWWFCGCNFFSSENLPFERTERTNLVERKGMQHYSFRERSDWFPGLMTKSFVSRYCKFFDISL